MSDAAGIFQFISAASEISRGAALPSIPPVWQRHLLTARRPPLVSFPHREYDIVPNTSSTGQTPNIPLDKMVYCSFFFSATDTSAIRRALPPLQRYSQFEIVSACSWRCRRIALSPRPDEEVRFTCLTDIRRRMAPPLPAGYHGNAVVVPAAAMTAEEVSKNPLHYAMELIRKAKQQATDEYVRSVADLMVE